MNTRNYLFPFLLLGFLVQCSTTAKSSSNTHNELPPNNSIALIQSIEEKLENPKLSEEERYKLKLQKAKILLDHNQYDEAVVVLNDVLKEKANASKDSELHLYLGKAYYGKSDYSKAINYLSQSERLDKNSNQHERKKLLAKSFFEEEEYYPALAALGKAYNIPNVKKDIFFYETAAQAYYKMAFKSKNTEQYKKAMQISELGLKTYPDSMILQKIYKESLEALGSVYK